MSGVRGEDVARERERDRDMEHARDMLATLYGLPLADLPDAARLALGEAALRTVTDPRLAGSLAGAAHRITNYAYRLCDRAFREGSG